VRVLFVVGCFGLGSLNHELNVTFQKINSEKRNRAAREAKKRNAAVAESNDPAKEERLLHKKASFFVARSVCSASPFDRYCTQQPRTTFI